MLTIKIKRIWGHVKDLFVKVNLLEKRIKKLERKNCIKEKKQQDGEKIL